MYVIAAAHSGRNQKPREASEMLADASIVPAFIRLCGATFGHGCAMGLQAPGGPSVCLPFMLAPPAGDTS